jgi:mono/diheme cytochrome c family protein
MKIHLILLLLSPSLIWASQLELPKNIEFPTVPMGEMIELEVVGLNRSSEIIKITKIQSSCGCTVANSDRNEVLPGGNVQLTFSVNTQQKQGPFQKHVRIFYENERRYQMIYIKGVVGPPKSSSSSHPKVMEGVSIFSKDCASCHVTPGNGKYGKFLYLTDCAFCHGTNRQGGQGPALKVPNPSWLPVIFAGKGLNMPGFLDKIGGVRTVDQLKSLVEFLESGDKEVLDLELTPEHLYLKNCSACHGKDQEGGIGPNLHAAIDDHTVESLTKLLHDGTNHLMMPSFLRDNGGAMSAEEINALSKFLKNR